MEAAPRIFARGFRPSPIYSTMGAAMVTGKLMGLDENGLVATIALALLLAWLVGRLERLLTPWRREA